MSAFLPRTPSTYFKTNCSSHNLILRASLPVKPKYKTLSEVATIAFVKALPDPIPASMIPDHDASNQNLIGFEWILMEQMPGASLQAKWKEMTWAAKKVLVSRVCYYWAQLFQREFQLIGNVYKKQSSQGELEVGELVTLEFFREKRSSIGGSRGPFEMSEAWLSSRLGVSREWAELEARDGKEPSGMKRTFDICSRLQIMVHNHFPPGHGREECVVFHGDFS